MHVKEQRNADRCGLQILGNVTEGGGGWIYSPDRGKKVYNAYGVTGFPETFFVNRQGVVVRKYVGPLDQQTLAAFVEEVLQ